MPEAGGQYYRDMSSRGPTTGRNRDRIRETRAKGQLNRMPRSNIFQRAADSFGGSKVNKSIHQMNPLPGLAGFAMSGAKNIMNNQIMHGQNRDYFGGNMLHDKIPQNVRESMMTQKDQDFYDKYMNLADLGGDRKQEYLDTANTAMRNAQNTARLNYGLSQIDPEGEYLNREGLPSYSQDLFGEGYNRFNMDRFKEAMGMGEGILDAIPAAERHPDVIDNYAQETFGGPGESEVNYSPHGPTYYDRAEGLDFAEDPNQPYVAPDDYVEDDFGAFYEDADTLAPERGLPFDDSARERAIMEQYPESFIGPQDNPYRKPGMDDAAGIRAIDRGLIPYPEYDRGPVNVEQFGRGEIPYGFDYDQSNKDRVDNYKLDQLLQQILKEEETPPPFSIGSTR